MSILISELRARSIIPHEVVRDVIDRILKSREVVTLMRAGEIARKAKFKYLHSEDIEKGYSEQGRAK